MAASASSRDLHLQRALHHLQQGNITASEAAVMPALASNPSDCEALHMLAIVRYRQGRLEDAAALLNRLLVLTPDQPEAQFLLGQALRGLGQNAGSIAAFAAAIALKSDYMAAHFELGRTLHGAGAFAEAEARFRTLLTLAPGHGQTLLALSAVPIDADRPEEAEVAARRALTVATEPNLIADLEQNLGVALMMQNRRGEALACYERIQTSGLVRHDKIRATLLEDVGRCDEALALLGDIIAREPDNLEAHRGYNSLLHRLGRNADFLCSYDKGPQTHPFRMAKASFLLTAERFSEAYALYDDIAGSDPENPQAGLGAAMALLQLKQYDKALAVYEAALARQPDNSVLHNAVVSTLLRMDEPGKAMLMAQQRLAVDPNDQLCLANLGDAYRLLGDDREFWLHGYERLIRVYDLEPPRGYSDMSAFNRDLDSALDRLHPPLRENIQQSLRGGTQTTFAIFGVGHALVDRLLERISETVTRYIAELAEEKPHPFLGRYSHSFRYSGSWSSRLQDRGFHISHVHPAGWISSCYYVAVPDAAADHQARQGWIKFGEPPHDLGFDDPVRRTIQPAPGRLVLFPSYTWHGTVPFHSAQARTTIAFDAMPA